MMTREFRWIIGWLGCATFVMGGEVRVTVVGGRSSLGSVPVLEALPDGSDLSQGAYRLVPVDGDGAPCPATVYRDGEETVLAAAIDRLDAGQARVFRLIQGAPEGSLVWRFDEKVGGLNVVAGSRLVASYNEGLTKPYWHPVLGPGGTLMTRDWPMIEGMAEQEDHPHQRSLWFTHGDVNGVDFWSSDPLNPRNPKHGAIRPTGRTLGIAGPGFATLRTTNRWQDSEQRPVCDDVQTFRLWDIGEVRLIDVEVEIQATHGAVVFGDTKEGVIGVRVPSDMAVDSGKGGRIVNAEGLTDAAAWGKPSPWVDYSGIVSNQAVGLAILDHPTNLRHPPTWHVRTYGLFAANPFGYHDFGVGKPGEHTVPAGGSLRFRYRVVLHAGNADDAEIARHFEAFARGPRVEVETEE